MWSSYIPVFDYANDPFVKPMVHVNTAYDIYFNNAWFNPDQQPFLAGRWAANHVSVLGLQAGQVCVMIQNFGRDEPGCDAAQGQPEPDFNTAFFRSADRILPESMEWVPEDLQSPQGGFPTHRKPVNPDDFRTARFYRHPFLTNAGKNPGNTAVAPMRDWMRQFLLGYKHQQTLNPSIPRPDKFYFDSEPILQPNSARNSVYLLKKIAENSTIWGNQPGQGWLVPGYGKSLKDLYDEKVADPAFNWPADGPNQPSGRGILDPVHGIKQQLVSFAGTNISYMIWWSEICYRAQNEVMAFSAYGPIHDPAYGWNDMVNGEYAVRVGNYHDFAADGGSTLPNSTPERAGWYMDRPTNNNSLIFPRDYGVSAVAREALPRISLQRTEGGHQFFGKGNQRYLGVRQWASGDVDTPSLYAGDSGLLYYTQQANYYLQGHPLSATQWEANMRNARRMVETSINSNGGGKSKRMVPWLNMSYTDDSDPNNPPTSQDPDNFVTSGEFREMQMMLRGKNIGECLFYTRGKRPEETPEDYLALLQGAWAETAVQMSRVYAGRVTSYTRASGPQVLPGGVSPYVPYDVSRLEFTLADPANLSVQEYDVDVQATVQIVGGQYKYMTALIVDIELTNPAYFGDNVYDVQIESSNTASGVTGEVYYWDGGQYLALTKPYEPSDYHTYGFWAPQSSSFDGRYRSRQAFQDARLLTFEQNGKTLIRLKLIHKATKSQTTTFVSRYELVQAVPVALRSGDSFGMMLPQSDLNADGTVDSADWEGFVDEWFGNSAAADLNLNNINDAGDIDAFVEAYATGT